LTNVYDYNENINAGYLSLKRSFQKTSVISGVRFEQTIVDGVNKSHKNRLKRNYLNFFPNFSIDFQPNEKHMLQLSYSYRIDRPAYEQIIPGRIFNNQLSYSVGNPVLYPQYSHNVNLEHFFNNSIGNSIAYTHINNSIFGYSQTLDSTNINVDTIINFANRDMLTYTLFIQMQFSKFYRMQFTGMGIYSGFNGYVGEALISTQATAVSLTMNNDFMLPNKYKVQLSMKLQTPFREGIQYSSSRGSINLAVRKKLLKDKMSVVVGIYDLLYTDFGSITIDLPNQTSLHRQKRDSRRVMFSIMYNFGNMKIERKNITEKDEDLQRIKKTQ